MTDGAGPAADFAALMNKAAAIADAEVPEAPYGYMRDAQTGEMRPKKAPGRPRAQKTLDELKAEKAGEPVTEGTSPGDRAPEQPRRRRRRGEPKEPKPEKPVPQFREGVIEKGVNKLYRKAGKMVRVMDRDIGQAIIDAAHAEDKDDITVGKAWEEVARHNPRIRRFLLRLIEGGAYSQLFWAHAPVLLAVLMKDAIRRHVPFHRLMEAFLDGGENGDAPADGTPFEGLTSEDMGDMMAVAQQMAAQMFSGRGMSMPRPPAPAAPPEAGL